MNRRSFLKSIGLLGAMAAVSSAANSSPKLEITNVSDKSNDNHITFYSDSREIMRIDSNGNFGIGVSPSNHRNK